jgi:hypothetical protein
MLVQARKYLFVFFSIALLLLTSCSSAPPSRYDAVQKQSTERGATAVVRESAKGGSFNRFFPAEQDGYTRVYTQEKKGFAEAKLKKEGKEVAVMAISDTLNTPTARDKFTSSTSRIAGYPAVEQGKTGTALLVADRFQVKVLSRDPAFGPEDRTSWLERFKLSELSQLK